MSLDNINAALKKYRMIEFLSGVFNIKKPLYLYPNTFILMRPDTILKRAADIPVFTSYITSSTTKYDGIYNVTIEGGVIDGAVKNAGFGNMVQFMHAKDITIRDVTFKDISGSHAIEFNSTKHGKILRCKFRGYIPDPNGYYREVIQIDFANYATLSIISSKKAACYDDTHCEDILIEDCIFEESENNPAPINAIGAHAQTASSNKHKNIRIINNVAKGRGVYKDYGIFVSLINVKDALIEGNHVSQYVRFARVAVPNKFYKTDGSTVSTPGSKIGSENVIFRKNMCVDPYDHFKAVGIYVYSKIDEVRHKNIIIEDEFYSVPESNKTGKNILSINNTDIAKIVDNTLITKFSKPVYVASNCTKVIDRNNDIF